MKILYCLIALMAGSFLPACKDKHRFVVEDIKLEPVTIDSMKEPPPPPPPPAPPSPPTVQSPYASLQDWLHALCESEKPDKSIIAYNFGIFETTTGYAIYLVGSKTFDSEDQDWATNKDFKPRHQYFPLPAAQYKKLSWQKVQQKIKAQLVEFTETSEFKNSFFAKAKAIMTGFDDGDLIRIK